MQPASHKSIGALAALAGLLAFNAQAVDISSSAVPISWNPSSGQIAGYYVCIGTNSHSYFQTNVVAAPQTSTALILTGANAFYLAVSAFDSNNNVSPLSNEIEYTNGLVTSQPGSPGGGPQPPPFPTTNPPVTTTGSGSGATNTHSSSPTPTFASLWGVPPYLTIGLSNAQPVLSILGTVGASMNIEVSSFPHSPDSWTLFTNVLVTNIAPIAATNPPANPDALDLAFVPAAQQFVMPPSQNETNMLFYRAVMPYDYAVLAGQVLPQKGYGSRLISVTMPGLGEDVCYVSAQSSYIHYLSSSNTFELRGSASNIRAVANTLAGSFHQTWTTASEFIFTNGVNEVLATVVATENPANDPVAKQAPSSSIVINF